MNRIFFLVISSFVLLKAQDCLRVAIKGNTTRMSVALITLSADAIVDSILKVIIKDLHCQIEPRWGLQVEHCALKDLTQKDLKQLHAQKILTAIMLTHDDAMMGWRIFDTKTGRMICGKKVPLEQDNPELTAHRIANGIWHRLTGFEGFFGSTIFYCQQRHHKKHTFRDLVHYSISEAKDHLFLQGGKFLAPRLNNDEQNPLLLYSEITPNNIRLLSVNSNLERSLVSNFDGLNMLPSFSPDGTKLVYCVSKNGKTQLRCYEYCDTHWVLKKLPAHDGQCTSPTILNNGDILFCSDLNSRYPQLYWYKAVTDCYEQLTRGYYCASPCYCHATGAIGYIRMTQGCMQLWMYTNDTHQQLTFDEGNKDEPSWSPGGDYLVFSIEKSTRSRVALMHKALAQYCYLTPEGSDCTYPVWCGVTLSSQWNKTHTV